MSSADGVSDLRVLMLHNRYLLPGGEDISVAMEARLLRDAGLDVELWEENNTRIEQLGSLRTAGRTIWSAEMYARIRAVLRSSRYQIVHVQNFFPLISPAVYYAARSQGVAVVQSLRNYRLMCPGGSFLRDGRVCEDCLGRSFALPGIVHGCYRRSRAATATVAAMLTAHRAMGTWRNAVDGYIALSQFGRRKFIEGGLPADRIFVKPNFVYPDPGPGAGGDRFALFVGRLDSQKGVETLLSAWEKIGDRVDLKIVGDGPLADRVREAASRIPSIEWLGQRTIADTYELMGRALFVVFPPIAYESFGRVIVEAFARATPVIASDIGPTTELVDDRRTGLLFPPGDAVALADRIAWAAAHDAELQAMRPRARAKFEDEFSSDSNLAMLLEIYAAAIASRQGRAAPPAAPDGRSKRDPTAFV